MISIEFLITSLVVILIPGTGVIYTISNGLFFGARASTIAALGCTLGIIPSLLAAVLGLALLFHMSALVFQVVKFIGVLYLIYLAWSMWRSAEGLSVNEKVSPLNWYSTLIKGFLINILNPKLSIFFLAFLPQFVPSEATTPVIAMIILGTVFMIMTFIVFVFYGLLAHSARTLILQSESMSKIIQRVFAGSFALLGIKLAMTDRG